MKEESASKITEYLKLNGTKTLYTSKLQGYSKIGIWGLNYSLNASVKNSVLKQMSFVSC